MYLLSTVSAGDLTGTIWPVFLKTFILSGFHNLLGTGWSGYDQAVVVLLLA